MTTPTTITLDTTLISAIISAAVAIFVACITVLLTTRSNNKNIKRAKKEELLEILYNLKSVTMDYYAENNFDKTARMIEKKELSLSKANIILHMYFLSSGISLTETTDIVNELFNTKSNYMYKKDGFYFNSLKSINKSINDIIGLKI
ncbi:hypothetical protein JY498_00585 [Serratia marcescens]|nr:hypothetical protein [Serratia marcescens]MBN5346995.1 hypothetical protein [Serratia marcescens]